MPKTAPRKAIALLATLLVAGGVDLAIVRGPAIMLDVSALAALLCF